MPAPPARASARDHGIVIGALPPGPHNAITDVQGVRVGHATVWRDEPDPPAGRGVARTGVTAILPRSVVELLAEPVPAGVAVLNGAGELTSAVQVAEWGVLETPILLTSTMQVGRALDAVVQLLCETDPTLGAERVVIPMVGECDDSWLNDARRVQIEAVDVRTAVDGATEGRVPQGAVGAGTGMVCFGWKGGIGTASRVLSAPQATVGVLLLTNFGRHDRLTVDGVPVGRSLPRPTSRAGPVDAGSCIGIVATDAACSAHQLERLARRVGLGLARCGSTASHGSGEIFAAFSTVASVGLVPLPDGEISELFEAVVDASEEAVLNSLFAADTVRGARGWTVPGLPVEETVGLLRAAGRAAGAG